MNDEIAPWSRPYFWRSGDKAMLLYFVFGEFPQELKLEVGSHGSRGLPDGVALHRFDKAMLAHWEGHPLRGALGEILRDDDPEAFKAARGASACLMLRGELDDPATLEYLRDGIGVIAALLDVGGAVVVDPQMLALFSAGAWRARYADGGIAPRAHALVLCSDDGNGKAWVHTRGMRKFARPDISLRGVPQRDIERAGAVAERLIDMQAQGMRFVDGTALEADGVPPGMAARLGGSLEDPQFNNRHVEFVWPDA